MIYIHVFMMIVIIICILYRESIVLFKILSDHDMHQQCDPKHRSYPPASCLIHIQPRHSIFKLKFFTRDFGFDHSPILCISIHPCCIFGMGVLIQMKLILTDFIVFGIWCLNQKKKNLYVWVQIFLVIVKRFQKFALQYINVICFWVSSEWIIKPMIFLFNYQSGRIRVRGHYVLIHT